MVNGQIIHVADETGFALTNLNQPQKFKDTTESWSILNGLNYFPIVGRRHHYFPDAHAIVYYVGWKIKLNGKTLEKVCYLYPNNQVVIQ